MSEALIVKAAALLRQSRYAVSLTGAGISTPSGIPDFRSPDSGLWSHQNPMEVASLQGFRYQPQAFYEWIRPLAGLMMSAKPNAAHHALVRLETMNIIQSVITQNIDLLHGKAGSKTVYEVHGHLREMTCIQCFKVYESTSIFENFLAEQTVIVPRCPSCNGVLKPNVVLFGEQLPARVLMSAERAAKQADLMLVAGSSLEVYPVADLPRIVKNHGGKLVLVNFNHTDYDRIADVVIHGDVAEVLPQIVAQLEGDIDDRHDE